jgi:hypothetical protein
MPSRVWCSAAELAKPPPKLLSLRLAALLEHLLGGASGGLARALGGGATNRPDLLPRQRGEVDACIGDAEFSPRNL